MKIETMGTRITDVPGVELIEVKASALSAYGVEIVIHIDGMAMPQGYGLDELKRYRDALSVAIEHAETMANMTPASAFTVGQVLNGDEALPIGTVIKDNDQDDWTVTAPIAGDNLTFRHEGAASASLYIVVRKYSPVTIASLPS